MTASFPAAVRGVAELLGKRGFASLVVGRSAWQAVGAVPSAEGIAETRLLCAAPPEALLAIPGVVPRARSRGAWLPSAEGPIELVPSAAPDPVSALRAAPWTVLALGVDPIRGHVLDPLGGLADLRARRLHPAEDATRLVLPSVAVASARLAAELGLSASEAALGALKPAAAALSDTPGATIRQQLDALLLAPYPERGVALLRETGLESRLVPGARPQAGALVALANGLVERWMAWLVGCAAPRILARLRTPLERARAIERRLALHPADQRISPRSGAVRKAVTRLGSVERLTGLLALRRHELDLANDADPAAHTQLDRLDELALAVARGTTPLIWSGRDVMRALGAPPGPAIGRALAFLQDCAQRDPAGNHPEQLRRWLDAWQREQT